MSRIESQPENWKIYQTPELTSRVVALAMLVFIRRILDDFPDIFFRKLIDYLFEKYYICHINHLI